VYAYKVGMWSERHGYANMLVGSKAVSAISNLFPYATAHQLVNTFGDILIMRLTPHSHQTCKRQNAMRNAVYVYVIRNTRTLASTFKYWPSYLVCLTPMPINLFCVEASPKSVRAIASWILCCGLQWRWALWQWRCTSSSYTVEEMQDFWHFIHLLCREWWLWVSMIIRDFWCKFHHDKKHIAVTSHSPQ